MQSNQSTQEQVKANSSGGHSSGSQNTTTDALPQKNKAESLEKKGRKNKIINSLSLIRTYFKRIFKIVKCCQSLLLAAVTGDIKNSN